MEELYKSLISGAETLIGQLEGHLFGMTEPEGPILILVNDQHQFSVSSPGRVGFLHEHPEMLSEICGRIDDGCDPCVWTVDEGSLIGTQLVTETTNCGYLLIFMPGYQHDTIQSNMDLIEMIMAQSQLICHLLEKNNHLYHAKLSEMSERSSLLCPR